MAFKKIYDPLYKYNIHIAYDETAESIYRYGQKIKIKSSLADLERTFKDSSAVVLHCSTDCDVLVAFLERNTAFKHMAHEAFHITCEIFRSRGLFLDSSSEEAYAYYLEWVFSRIDCFLRQEFSMKKKPAKSKFVTKAEFNQYKKKDVKDDMKMIKKAVKKK